jgi:single-strand DNA-binding protein
MPYQLLIIQGNLGRNPDTRYTPDGKPVATFSVAVSSKYGDKESTEWFNCVAWNKTAEIAQKYLVKGAPVLVEGRIQTREYEAKDGTKKKSVEVIASRIVLLGSKSERKEPEPTPDNRNFEQDQITDSDIPF